MGKLYSYKCDAIRRLVRSIDGTKIRLEKGVILFYLDEKETTVYERYVFYVIGVGKKIKISKHIIRSEFQEIK